MVLADYAVGDLEGLLPLLFILLLIGTGIFITSNNPTTEEPEVPRDSQTEEKEPSSQTGLPLFSFLIILFVYAVISLLGAVFTTSNWSVLVALIIFGALYGITFLLVAGVSVLMYGFNVLSQKYSFKKHIPLITSFPWKVFGVTVLLQIFFLVFNTGDCEDGDVSFERGNFIQSLLSEGPACGPDVTPWIPVSVIDFVKIAYAVLFIATLILVFKSLKTARVNDKTRIVSHASLVVVLFCLFMGILAASSYV